jgi:aminoglycoside phosphotransferase (APT) family kinase protein
VVQLVRDGGSAARIIAATRVLGEHGIAVPAIRRSRTTARGTYIVTDHVAGKPGPSLVDGPRAAWLSTGMAELIGRFRTVAAGSVEADPAWTSARHFADAAPPWIAALADADTRRRAQASVDRIVSSDWTPVLTHGDFAPANILVRDDGSLVLLDLGAVAERHPLLDRAWWALIVRYHHGAESPALPNLADAALPDVAAVRAIQLHADANTDARPHAHDLTMAALSWAEERPEPPPPRPG